MVCAGLLHGSGAELQRQQLLCARQRLDRQRVLSAQPRDCQWADPRCAGDPLRQLRVSSSQTRTSSFWRTVPGVHHKLHSAALALIMIASSDQIIFNIIIKFWRKRDLIMRFYIIFNL